MKNERITGHNTREDIMRYLTDYWVDNQRSPSIREICEGVGVKSSSAVKYHLDILQGDGRVTINHYNYRRQVVIPDTIEVSTSVDRLP